MTDIHPEAAKGDAVLQRWLDAWTARYGAGMDPVPFKHTAEPEPGIEKPTIGHLRAILERLAGLEAENERLQRSEAALTSTIRALPDATANAAANLAHARAQRDENAKRVTELRGEVKDLYARLATANRVIEVADDNCSCMAVIAAWATVDNENDAAECAA